MLRRLHAKGFKSLANLEVSFPALTVLFGPNAAGKSNILEAAQMLARIGTSVTLADAFAGAVRGYPLEAFAFPEGGYPALLGQESVRLTLEGDLALARDRLRYRVAVEARPDSGALTVQDEYLAKLGSNWESTGAAAIEKEGGQLRVRRPSRGRPPHEPLGQGYALVSDRRLGAPGYRLIEACRAELEAWRVYYLDPRTAMRAAAPPTEVSDIGVLGGDIAPYLYRLRAEHPKHFAAVGRTLRALVPSVEKLDVDLDERRGTLDIRVRQDGIDFPSRLISEGTLRVLALCCIAASPWGGGMIAFEEPENGVHPRRLELIAQLLASLALEQGRQVVVTTHSVLFCEAVLKVTSHRRQDVAMLGVRRTADGTRVAALEHANGLFSRPELIEALSAPTEDGVFEGLLLRGLLDG